VSENPFYRLSPFIQEFIYANQWTELRAIQVEACRVIFDTDSHLLLAAGTASGKTEAAFLPVLTLLHDKPSSTVGVLYIGPLKALINDQFARLQDLLKEADIPAWHWHGDVSQSQKTKLLRAPRGVLQITPESLESLFVNRSNALVRMFADLRFVVIDELHAFMGSDRGTQVICQINRLERLIRVSPRRIGLSATLGDYHQAEAWLSSGTESPVVTPRVASGPLKIRLALEHFWSGDAGNDKHAPKPEFAPPFAQYVYRNSKGRKCLVFANNRAMTEEITRDLRQLAIKEKSPDVYHVHHGSISAALRESAERAMKDTEQPTVIAATLTLELGIDIGQLERIIQIGPPHSVASFLQRLGRSGRRGNASEMFLVSEEERPSSTEILPDRIPWALLQAIAVIQLYLEERWIEPAAQSKYPFSLLYHQTMSTLASLGELSPSALAQRVLTLPPFEYISQDDYRELLLHLVEIDHIQQTEERGLIIGLTGEQVVRNFRFYAVFKDDDEYAVFADAAEIGSIMYPPPPGERFALAGRTWEVIDIDLKRHVVSAKRVQGRASSSWLGGGAEVNARIIRRIRQALIEDCEYGYLQAGARARLGEARQLARASQLCNRPVLSLGGNLYCILPWLGTAGCRTLERFLRFVCSSSFSRVSGTSPYFLRFETNVSDGSQILRTLIENSKHFSPEDLLGANETSQFDKYDEFVPPRLLREAFFNDHLDTEALGRFLKELQQVGGWEGEV